MRLSPLALHAELLQILHKGETIAAAMRRLAGKPTPISSSSSSAIVGVRRRPPPLSDNGADSASTDIATAKSSEVGPDRPSRVQLDRLTEVVDQLLSYGLTGIFNKSFDAVDAAAFMWEYQLDGIIHGPYTSQQVLLLIFFKNNIYIYISCFILYFFP